MVFFRHPENDPFSTHFGLTFMVNESKYSMHEFYEVYSWEQTIFSENADDISCAHSVMIRKFIVFVFCFSKTSWEVFFFVKPSTKASEKQRMGGLQGPNSWRNRRQLTNTPPCNGMKVNRISWLHGLTLILMAFIQSLQISTCHKTWSDPFLGSCQSPAAVAKYSIHFNEGNPIDQKWIHCYSV